ncbi:hypothetical protein [Methylobacterium sp. CM6247]
MTEAPKRHTVNIPNSQANRPKQSEIVRPILALIDRDGTVTGLFRRPDELRAFLQGCQA